MASSRDVRDLLGLAPGDAQKPAVQKKPKPAAPQRKFQGVAREVAALYGERPPPVAVYEEKKTYRAKRQNAGPAKKWIQQPFANPARTDGLVLRHWRRKPGPRINPEGTEDMSMVDDTENKDPRVETQYEFAKYNVQVEVPTFTDEEYDTYLKSDDWSKEETYYLLDMIKEYYQRWAVIQDRYEFQPTAKPEPLSQETNGDSQALSTLPFPPSKNRTVEDLKARFYDISAKLMKLHIPEVQMDADQYALYETLTKYDPHLERNRKTLAAALMNRSVDEVKEEEFLLTELQRINMAANRLDAERAELRERLESPITNQSLQGGMAQFQSSQALTALFSQLFQQDRSKKRQSGSGGRLSLSATDIIGTPTSANQQLGGAARRASMAQHASAQQPIRTLSPANEQRFNISTHDRLTSGVTFGSDKLLKMRQAKSNVQTQKIAASLSHLNVSEIITIPTNKVGEVFEKLIVNIGKLLDVRKLREKEEQEAKYMEEMKARLNGEGGDVDKQEDGGEVKQEEDGEGDNEEVEEEEDEEEEENQDDENPDDTEMGDGDEDAEEQDAEGEEDELEDDEPEIDVDDADADPDVDIDPDVDVDVDVDEGEDEDAEGEDDSRSQSIRQPSEAISTRTGGHKRSASILSVASNRSSKRRR